MTITNLSKTCSACPSQWEGNIEDGRMFYVRYKHGYLTIELSKKPTDNVYNAMGGDSKTLYSDDFGDSYCGVLTEEEFKDKMIQCGFVFNNLK